MKIDPNKGIAKYFGHVIVQEAYGRLESFIVKTSEDAARLMYGNCWDHGRVELNASPAASDGVMVKGRRAKVFERDGREFWIRDEDSAAELYRDGVWRTDCNYGTDIWPTREAAEAFIAANADAPAEPAQAPCGCITCLDALPPDGNPIPRSRRRMVVCAICGNKRCPHATDHRHECTGSNKSGQPGSVFGPPAQAPASEAPPVERELRQLFKHRFDCWAKKVDDPEPDDEIGSHMAMSEDGFVEVVLPLVGELQAENQKLRQQLAECQRERDEAQKESAYKSRLFHQVTNNFMRDALVAIAGAVCTPEKGYAEDGGFNQLLADIERLRKQHDDFKLCYDIRNKHEVKRQDGCECPVCCVHRRLESAEKRVTQSESDLAAAREERCICGHKPASHGESGDCSECLCHQYRSATLPKIP